MKKSIFKGILVVGLIAVLGVAIAIIGNHFVNKSKKYKVAKIEKNQNSTKYGMNKI